MRKSTKLVTLVAALVAICSLTAVAAGWVNEGGTWYYTDKNGDYVTSAWKADGANYYWLDEDGAMATNQLVEDGDKLYYVGGDGARVTGGWVAVEADDADADLGVDHRWYYFQANGKAYKDKTVTIGENKYHFDEDGKMVFGFVDEKCEIINDYEDLPLRASYYYGDNDNGAMQVGWLQWTDGFTTTDKYDGLSEIWFYFDGTTKSASKRGLKLAGVEKKINGQHYLFDEDGVMLSEWQNSTVSTGAAAASTSKYYSSDVDGHKVKSQWIYKVPSEDVCPDDYDDETERWFYVDKNGKPYAGATKKINGKYYTFDETGIMKSGLVLMKGEDASLTSPTNFTFVEKAGSLTAQKIMDSEYTAFYFSGDEKADGSMKTGTYKIEVDDGEYTFTFDKHGRAITGKSGNKLYINGLLLDAGDDRYKVVEYTKDDEYKGFYLVSSTGTIIKSGKYVKDANDDYYATFEAEDGQHCVKILDCDDAAKAAKAFAKDGTEPAVKFIKMY